MEENVKYEYVVVRTYDTGSNPMSDLQRYFDICFEFVRASDFVPSRTVGGSTYKGYIEYILRRRRRNYHE